MLAGLWRKMDENLAQLIAQDILELREIRALRDTVGSLDMAYDLQDEVVALLPDHCGRKIAMNSSSLMQLGGISEPIVGYVLGNGPISPSTGLSLSDYRELAIEPEFAAVIGQDIAAGTVLDPAQIGDVVERFSLSFEILDKRHDTFEMHPPSFVANNVFNAGVVLDEASLDLSELTAATYRASFTAAGQTVFDACGTAPQNPIEACAFVINHFTSRGQTIKAGEVVLCGAHHPPMVIEGAGEYVFSLSGSAQVSLSISV